MKLKMPLAFSLILLCLFSAFVVHAQTTSFSYQGRLTDSSLSANGSYDFEFVLYDSAGNIVASNMTMTTGVQVVNGIFTVKLDFGAASFPGADRFLEIRVKKPAVADYTPLSPRQQINSAPYAVRAISASQADSAINATNAANASSATMSYNVYPTSGDNVISALNNAATNTTISSSRLSADVVKLTPNATQNSTTTNFSTAILDATATTVDNGNNVLGASRFRLNADGGFYISATTTLEEGFGAVPTSGEGMRMMWYPGKYAFRAGKLDSNFPTLWDEANIGSGSFAFGLNNLASGMNAISFGERARATGNNSIAIGQATKAYGANSIAIGKYATTCQVGNCDSPTFYNGVVNISDGCAGFLSEGLTASADNQINMRGCGGFRFFTNQNLSAGVQVASGGGSWSSLSDRNMKENFIAVDKRDILQKVLKIPVSTWNYKSQEAAIRHIGVMAQDFKAAFGVGENDKMITTVDADGVALAAIQGLNEKLEENTAELKKENERLKQKLDAQQTQLKQQQATIDALKKLVCSQNRTADVCK